MMTTETIMDALYGITYSSTAYTKERRFRVSEDDEFENFENFPLIVIESGDEIVAEQANRVTESTFYPAVHFFDENVASDTMETWRKDIRNAIYGNATLRAAVINMTMPGIEANQSENRKLNHLKFSLEITFDTHYT